MSFNHWDVLLFIPIAYGGWKGFRNGIVIEIASIAGLIAGVYVAANFSEYLCQWIKNSFALNGSWLGFIVFLLTFIGVVFGVYLLAKILEKGINLLALKFVNKVSGLLFGAIKMTLILSIILNLLGWMDQYIPVLQRSRPNQSLIFNGIRSVAPTILPILTDTEWMIRAERTFDPLFKDEDIEPATEQE